MTAKTEMDAMANKLEDGLASALDERRAIPVRPRALPRLGRQVVFMILALTGLGALTLTGLHWFTLTQSYESTDDAFIDGQIVQIAPKVAGRVDQVFVNDNQEVKKGDRLIRIDARDFDAALRQTTS